MHGASPNGTDQRYERWMGLRQTHRYSDHHLPYGPARTCIAPDSNRVATARCAMHKMHIMHCAICEDTHEWSSLTRKRLHVQSTYRLSVRVFRSPHFLGALLVKGMD